MRGVSACFAAASRLFTPSVRSRLVSAKDRAILRRSFVSLSEVISCTITSGLALATACTMAARLSASAIAGSPPARRIASVLAGLRVQPDHGMAACHQQRHEAFPDRAGGACNEDTHITCRILTYDR